MKGLQLLTPKEFSDSTGMHYQKVLELTKVRGFPAFQLGRTYHINFQEAIIWIQKNYGNQFETERSLRHIKRVRKS